MPGVRQYGSSSTLNRNGTSGGESSGSQEALYSHSKTDSLYRSSPDLSRGSYHQRTSSADSLDGGGSTGSYYGNHSRQSSDSAENYPTRSLSTSGRKPSVSADPLQFVKTRGADVLAKQAEEQMRLAEQFKKERNLKEMEEEKIEPKVVPVEEGDWQSNLSNWKNRRKSKSERTFSLRDELEEKLQEEEPKERPAIKTFSQMKEEREKRKSGLASYPLNDDGDEDVFKAISTPGVFRTPRTRGVAAIPAAIPAVTPTESTPIEEKKVKKAEKKGVAAWAVDSDEASEESSEEEAEDKNNNQLSSSSAQAVRQPASTPSSTTPSSLSSPSEHSDGPGVEAASRDEGPAPRSRRVGQVDRFGEGKDTIGGGVSVGGSEGVARRVSRDLESRSSARAGPASSEGKITDIRKQFEKRQEAPVSRSGAAVDGVDVKSRSKSFEKPAEEAVPPPRPARTSLGLNRVGDRKDESNHSFSSFSSSSSTTTYPSSRLSGRDYVEKAIKISQKPNNERGFGFTVSGGAEKRQPLVVEKVSLGGAADVCELKARDELISVNRRDVSKMTHPEVTQLISEAVRTGQLELRVKRFLDSSKDEDEDFLSSDEELSETMEKHDRNEVQNAHSFDSIDSKDVGDDCVDQELARERNWMREEAASAAARMEESKPSLARPQAPVAHLLEQDEVEEEILAPVSASRPEQPPPRALAQSPPRSLAQPPPRSLAQTENKPVFEVETRSSITLRKASLESPKAADAVSGRDGVEPRRARNETTPEQSNSDFGPPSILRKWQRQRPPSDYGQQAREESSLVGSSSQSWHPDNAEEGREDAMQRASRDVEESLHQTPTSRRPFAFDTGKDHRRMRDWDRQQDQIRQTDPSDKAVDSDFAREQEEFEQKQRQMEQQYQAEQQRAAQAERQKQEQEQQLLEPELERTRLLEERRAERRARLQRQQQEEEASQHASPQHAPPQHASPQHISPQHISPQHAPPQHSPSQPRAKETITVPLPQSHQPGGLVIDPRNRHAESREEMPAFQLNIRKTETSEGLIVRATPPTQVQHAPHGYEQQEAERLRREEEDMRRQLEEKEARIRQEEERIRQEREELRKEQERLRREKEEMERKREEAERRRKEPEYADHNGEATAFEPVSSRVRGGTYSARISAAPVQRYGSPSPSQYSSTVVIDPKVSQTYSVTRPAAPWSGQAEDRNPELRPGNISTGLSGSRERLTREDLIAMNRKSTPLQVRPDLPSPTDSSPTSPGPIVREAPNKTQLHSLNAVPKPRLRGANDWITSPRDEEGPESGRDQASRRYSEVTRRPFPGPGVGGGGGHWLVEEAERRRLADSTERKQYASGAGPIKPLPELTSANKWSEPSRRQSVPAMMSGAAGPGDHRSMPAQIRQTLLQKTAGARTSTGSNYSQELNAPPASYSPSRGSPAPRDYGYEGQQGYPDQHSPLPPAGRAPPPPREQAHPVSGKQKCSHCGNELGFGAAMVIETLGLYYHVHCFRCCVCHTALGSGVEGTDVRVRVDKLHCPNCYSNDEAGLKFSKV